MTQERDGKNEFKQFLSISKASAGEARSQAYRALDGNYINQVEFDEISKDKQSCFFPITLNYMSILWIYR